MVNTYFLASESGVQVINFRSESVAEVICLDEATILSAFFGSWVRSWKSQQLFSKFRVIYTEKYYHQ